MQMLFLDSSCCCTHERWLTLEQIIGNATERIDISGLRGCLILPLLRGSKVRTEAILEGLCRCAFLNEPCDSEVGAVARVARAPFERVELGREDSNLQLPG